MATAKQRKLRHQRRIAHARRAHGLRAERRLGIMRPDNIIPAAPKRANRDERRTQVVEFVEDQTVDHPLTDVQKQTATTSRTRAKCPVCGTSQKLTKAGVMGKHSISIGDDKRVCPGAGSAPD